MKSKSKFASTHFSDLNLSSSQPDQENSNKQKIHRFQRRRNSQEMFSNFFSFFLLHIALLHCYLFFQFAARSLQFPLILFCPLFFHSIFVFLILFYFLSANHPALRHRIFPRSQFFFSCLFSLPLFEGEKKEHISFPNC